MKASKSFPQVAPPCAAQPLSLRKSIDRKRSAPAQDQCNRPSPSAPVHTGSPLTQRVPLHEYARAGTHTHMSSETLDGHYRVRCRVSNEEQAPTNYALAEEGLPPHVASPSRMFLRGTCIISGAQRWRSNHSVAKSLRRITHLRACVRQADMWRRPRGRQRRYEGRRGRRGRRRG